MDIFFDQPGNGGAGYDLKEKCQSTAIRGTTLDSFFENIGTPVQFIKCDVEIHEDEVFRGGINLLQRDRPMLLIEICADRIESANSPPY